MKWSISPHFLLVYGWYVIPIEGCPRDPDAPPPLISRIAPPGQRLCFLFFRKQRGFLSLFGTLSIFSIDFAG